MAQPRSRRVYFRPEEETVEETGHIDGEQSEVNVDGDEMRSDEKLNVGPMESPTRQWHRMGTSKRPFSEEQIVEEIVHQYSSGEYSDRLTDMSRRRVKVKKSPQFLQRVQTEKDCQEMEYEERPATSHQGARVVSMSARMGENVLQQQSRIYPRGSMMTAPTPRLSQSGPVRMPGTASQLAAQRLPTISGGPPKENKPLKVVTLLPSSRRPGGGPPRPVVSSIRPIGGLPQPKSNKIPHMSIEKQADAIVNQSVKLGEQLISGQTIGDFNRVVELLNTQIQDLQEDNKRLNMMYTGLIEFKDNRIKQLETTVEKLRNELGVAVKNWHAQMIVAGTPLVETKQTSQVVQLHHQIGGRRPQIAQVTAEGDWIIEEGSNGEIDSELIEEEVDEETFLRMQQMHEEQELIMQQHVDVEEEIVVSNDEIPSDEHHGIV